MKQHDRLIKRYSRKKYKLPERQVMELVSRIMARKPIWGYMRSLGIKGKWKKPKPRLREGRVNTSARPKRRRKYKLQLL